MGFGFTIEFALVLACGRLRPQGRFEPFFNEALTHTGHGGRMHLQRLTNGFIAPGRSLRATISFQQNTGMEQSTGSGFAAPNHVREMSLLLSGQSDNILLHGKVFRKKSGRAGRLPPDYPVPFHSAHYP
jgi:hypothetical protein